MFQPARKGCGALPNTGAYGMPYTEREQPTGLQADALASNAVPNTAPILTAEASAREGSGPVEPLDQRYRLSWYRSRGLLPDDVAPCAISAAHVRLTGRQPARDPQRRICRAYSPVELLAALAEVNREQRQKAIARVKRLAAAPPPPPPPPLPSVADLWDLALGWIARHRGPVWRFSDGRLSGTLSGPDAGALTAVVELHDPALSTDERSWLGHALAKASKRRTYLRVLPLPPVAPPGGLI